MTPLRVALLGCGASGRLWRAALADHPSFRLRAVADLAPRASDPSGGPADPAWYDDVRLLLVEQPLDAAVIALPPAAAESVLAVAAERRVAVLKETPVARTFEDARRLVAMFHEADVPLAVASRWRFERPLVERLASPPLETIRAAGAFASADPGPELGWRGESQRGGGVLRDVGYDLLDLFVALLGLPGDVTAHGGRFAATAPDRFDAEDGATLLLRYSHGAAATLTAVWRPRPATREALIVGSGGILRIQPGAVEFHSDDGDSVILRRPPDADLRRAVLDQFADAVRSRPAHYAGRAVDQLRTAAVFDAAHLSRSTHAAESPVRVYQLAGLPPPRTTGRERLAPV